MPTSQPHQPLSEQAAPIAMPDGIQRLVRQVARDLGRSSRAHRSRQAERVEPDPAADRGRAVASSPQEARGHHLAHPDSGGRGATGGLRIGRARVGQRTLPDGGDPIEASPRTGRLGGVVGCLPAALEVAGALESVERLVQRPVGREPLRFRAVRRSSWRGGSRAPRRAPEPAASWRPRGCRARGSRWYPGLRRMSAL